MTTHRAGQQLEAAEAVTEPGASARELLSGGTILGVAMVVANAGNYVLNLLLGRWLSPDQFADANLMVTLMLTLTSIALCLQLVAAHFVGVVDRHTGADRVADDAAYRSAALARTLRTAAWCVGLATALVLAGPAIFWQHIFHTASWVPFVVLGAGMPFYLVQAVGRGVMQGRLRFQPLAITFLIEMAVRVGLGVALVSTGLGVTGATIALSCSFVGTWFTVRLLSGREQIGPSSGVSAAQIRGYAGSVSVLLVGQIIANNSDVLIAKAFFSTHAAGIYSAVALVGRAVFFLSWSVATVVFPAAAARHARGGATGSLMRGSLVAVSLIGAVCTLAAWTVGGSVLQVVLGPDYAGLSGPLAAYAGMTTLFAVANLVASHTLSLGKNNDAWLLLAGSLVQVVVLLVLAGRHSIIHLILGQAVVMALLAVIMGGRVLLAPRGTSAVPSGDSQSETSRIEPAS